MAKNKPQLVESGKGDSFDKARRKESLPASKTLLSAHRENSLPALLMPVVQTDIRQGKAFGILVSENRNRTSHLAPAVFFIITKDCFQRKAAGKIFSYSSFCLRRFLKKWECPAARVFLPGRHVISVRLQRGLTDVQPPGKVVFRGNFDASQENPHSISKKYPVTAKGNSPGIHQDFRGSRRLTKSICPSGIPVLLQKALILLPNGKAGSNMCHVLRLPLFTAASKTA